MLYITQLAGKKITSLPEEELEYMSVRELHMNHNSLTSLPPDIAKMANIQELYLYDNCIENLPAELCSLSTLRVCSMNSLYV